MERKGMTGFVLVVVNTFMVIGLWGCADSRHEMYDSIPDLGEWERLHDGEELDFYWRYGNKVYWIDAGFKDWNFLSRQKSLQKADPRSFQVCRGTQYARDNNHVYYPISQLCVDYDCTVESLPVSEEMVNRMTGRYIVKDASPRTFKYIGNGYAIDRKHMYDSGREIPWNDKIIESQMKKHREGKNIDSDLDSSIRTRRRNHNDSSYTNRNNKERR